MSSSDEEEAALHQHLQFLLDVSGKLTSQALKAEDPSEHNVEAAIEAGKKRKIV